MPDAAGPTTAAGMAAAKGWRSSIVPALLVGTFGYAIATFVNIALGVSGVYFVLYCTFLLFQISQ